MKSINPVKMLSALALVLLMFSATEGRILEKCNLKKQLEAAQLPAITAMGEKISTRHLIARLVCKANSTDFNTSFVKAIMVNKMEKYSAQAPPQGPPQGPPQAPAGGLPQGPPQGPPQAPAGGLPQGPPQAPAGGLPQGPPQGPPQAPAGGLPQGPPQAPAGGLPQGPPQAPAGGPPQAKAGVPPRGPPQAPAGVPPRGPPQAPAGVPPRGPPQAPSGGPPQAPSGGPSQAPAEGPSKPHTQAPTEGLHGSGHEDMHPELNAPAKVSGHLYGVFQLSDQLACDSGMMPSLNACNMSCSALLDDDITDDISCLKALFNSMKPKPKGKPTDVTFLEALMKKDCRSVVPSTYFSECV